MGYRSFVPQDDKREKKITRVVFGLRVIACAKRGNMEYFMFGFGFLFGLCERRSFVPQDDKREIML